MKKSSLVLILLFCVTLVSAQTVPLQVKFNFINIEEGYDHVCKTQVLIDGELVAESESVKQSKGAVFTVKVPKGSHDVEIVNWTLYEGQWEPHTIENNYSIDCIYQESGHAFSKPSKFIALYDLDSGATYKWAKASKKK